MKPILYLIFGFPLLFFLLHTIIRTIRYFYQFPMLEFLANLIDNPLRHWIQPMEKPAGHLAFSEVLMDPDYPQAKSLIQKANRTGFRLKKKSGNFFSYTIIFKK
ncbi:MAG: hypothetical protein Q7U53_13415 [Anaerolineaceae bacterium]|nr:hypothetical protein [Anaerolineaceae bacterium]